MVLRYYLAKRRVKAMEQREGVALIVKEIKRKTRKRYRSKEMIRVVLESLR